MDHRGPVVRVCLMGVAFGLILAGVLVTKAGAAPQDKVTICHRTNSVRNPYVQQTVNENSIVMPDGSPAGHGLHTGPVYPQPDWGDIIPPFTYTNDRGGSSVYDGMNWSTGGQAVWNGGCEVDLTEPPEETTTTTTTTLPLPTTTSAPTTTTRPGSTTTRPGSTTTQPGSTTTHPGSTTTHPGSTTSQPGSTTSQPGGGTTTTTTTEPPLRTTPTTAPPFELPSAITDPGNGVEIMPPVEAVVVDPGGRTVDLGQLTTSQRMALEAVVDSLAGTGQNDAAMTLGALGLILLGSFLLVGSRRIGWGGTRHRVRQQGGAPFP